MHTEDWLDAQLSLEIAREDFAFCDDYASVFLDQFGLFTQNHTNIHSTPHATELEQQI